MTKQAKPQRLVFGETLVELGAENERIVVLDADVSSSTQTKHFAAKYPDRFFNFGIAEANMVSAAAGLATCGYVPFVSTFALFISMRAGDQVRAQVAYPRLNVKLAGGYAGLSDFAGHTFTNVWNKDTFKPRKNKITVRLKKHSAAFLVS